MAKTQDRSTRSPKLTLTVIRNIQEIGTYSPGSLPPFEPQSESEPQSGSPYCPMGPVHHQASLSTPNIVSASSTLDMTCAHLSYRKQVDLESLPPLRIGHRSYEKPSSRAGTNKPKRRYSKMKTRAVQSSLPRYPIPTLDHDVEEEKSVAQSEAEHYQRWRDKMEAGMAREHPVAYRISQQRKHIYRHPVPKIGPTI
ncbi:hypothetical protein E8E14_002738 [Neopestalotiopsis sp. 37M]|nr:hypothetical protein E8E14_002738 [Neopestalotiopsis sp. 37M]